MNTEVYLDHVRGLIAVAWPTRQGYTIYNDRGGSTSSYTLPAGMTRLQEPPAAAPASCATTRPLATVPRQRQPRTEEASA